MRDTLVAAQRLPGQEQWTVKLAFRVADGRTDLFAHAVVPTPDRWPEVSLEKLHGVHGRPDGWAGPTDADRDQIARHSAIGDWLMSWVRDLDPPSGRLTTAIIRSALTGELERIARARALDWSDTGFFPKGVAGGSSRPRGSRGDPSFLAGVAARYVELCAETDQPIEVLASEMGAKLGTTRNRIYRARERGLLTSAGRGRQGGRLTERAINLLGGSNDGEH